jgi:hypothetical protein
MRQSIGKTLAIKQAPPADPKELLLRTLVSIVTAPDGPRLGDIFGSIFACPFYALDLLQYGARCMKLKLLFSNLRHVPD